MYISRKLISAVVTVFLLTLMVMSDLQQYTMNGFPIVFFVAGVVISYLILTFIGSEPKQQSTTQHKFEKMLQGMNDNDLYLLRHRLMQDEREEQYGSMAELMQSGKRKNEAS